jgi:hypothetical protein
MNEAPYRYFTVLYAIFLFEQGFGSDPDPDPDPA